MEAIIFSGIQASGKSTFFKERFFTTHVRLNLDMLRTRQREGILLHACIEGQQSFVVDNANLTAVERARYIAPAKAAGFRVIGFHFESTVADALRRNGERAREQQVPRVALLGAHKRLELPAPSEGFDELFYVRIGGSERFVVEEWQP